MTTKANISGTSLRVAVTEEEEEEEVCDLFYVDFQGLNRNCGIWEGCGYPGCISLEKKMTFKLKKEFEKLKVVESLGDGRVILEQPANTDIPWIAIRGCRVRVGRDRIKEAADASPYMKDSPLSRHLVPESKDQYFWCYRKDVEDVSDIVDLKTSGIKPTVPVGYWNNMDLTNKRTALESGHPISILHTELAKGLTTLRNMEYDRGVEVGKTLQNSQKDCTQVLALYILRLWLLSFCKREYSVDNDSQKRFALIEM